ncbi:hypothetical protein KGM_206882 [Danaus plexippus plexippus]|uniref:Uncharacterized protein n=1 Tax=Danaus plexippus plexippus TaxID=278856 RepID=A0A212FMM1_DANPL|nr:hypothetical protein KGM_206882 [Danaus plexippus plexippus]
MDIYGYSSYPYNQSDELAKQMFAQQALASSVRGMEQPHDMPAPSGSPWNVQGIPWSMQSPPNLVHFTAQTPDTKVTTIVHCKRKSLDVDPPIPAKQFITEEKMAAHLNALHISSSYTQHSLASEDVMEVVVDPTAPVTTTSISEKLKGHTIVLSDDVKKIQDEPIIPASLIERLQKPQMSLVVWRPKENILEKMKEEKDVDSEVEKLKKRNGVLVVEHSRMDMEM